MLKIQPKCRVCQAIEKNPKLLQVIFNSAHYLSGGKPLTMVARDYAEDFTYESLQGHVKKHQFMTQKEFNDRSLKNIAKKAQDKVMERAIDSYDVFDKVINRGIDQLDDDSTRVKPADLIAAARYKKEFQLKEKDQELAMLDMIYHFASGENNESKSYDKRIIEGETVQDYDPTAGTTENPDAGTNRPSGIHYPPAWHAITPGANPLPSTNNQP